MTTQIAVAVTRSVMTIQIPGAVTLSVMATQIVVVQCGTAPEQTIRSLGSRSEVEALYR